VAESGQPRILFETGLPPRYYLPLTDVRLDLLRPSATQSHCPYKGTASYWSLDAGATVHEDFVWIYRSPLPESQKIAGLACFYNEKVDLYLDGSSKSGRTPNSADSRPVPIGLTERARPKCIPYESPMNHGQ
jgi:uncharacterized protein (DUF427 family)